MIQSLVEDKRMTILPRKRLFVTEGLIRQRVPRLLHFNKTQLRQTSLSKGMLVLGRWE